MNKVLLAIDGTTHSPKGFQYALQLCQWVKAEMEILQVVSPQKFRSYLDKVQKGADNARRYFESSFAAAAFAEAGEHETAEHILADAKKETESLLSESKEAGIQCHLTFKTGNPKEEIADYVKKHREIILTIYDEDSEEPGTAEGASPKSTYRRMLNKLKVPLVVIHR
jgi:nucleotide-binding universal stress UspA family protein